MTSPIVASTALPPSIPGRTADEAARLAAVSAYAENGLGAELHTVVQLAADLLRTPIALISLVQAERQIFVAHVGVDLRETRRDESFCAHALHRNEVLVVPDALQDVRFANNPLVTGAPGIRFYAGAPLISPQGGHRLGALCVIDRKPRPVLDEREQRILSGLAALAVDQMEVRRIAAERRASLARFDRMAAASSQAVVCTDADGIITSWNASAERLLGWTAEEAMGQSVDLIIPQAQRKAHGEGMARARQHGVGPDGRVIELRALRRDGTLLPLEVALSSWRDDEGRHAFGASMRDISQRLALADRLRGMAYHDSLTGLGNRAELGEALQELERTRRGAALVLLGIDGMKHVNTVMGQAFGDEVLRESARRLQETLAGRGVLRRIGGDEFAVLLDACYTPDAMAAELVDALCATPFHLQQRVLRVGASAGVALAPSNEVAGLLANADLALRQAKASGGRAWRNYDASLRAAERAQRTLIDELRQAVENREFVLYYQPQVELPGRTLIAVEALLRWQHPRRGLLAPGDFLSTLDTLPLAATVGDWAIDEACRQAVAWRAQGLDLRVGVNVFAEQIRRGGLEETVEQALARHALPPEALELELTETIVLRKTDADLQPMRHLHARGVGIAFDDFGTGYASLATLKRFPLTRLKIDRSFVSDLGTDRHDEAIVEAVLALGHRLGLDVIAEGVETNEQERYLVAHGCRKAQGYLYGKPMPAAHIAPYRAPV